MLELYFVYNGHCKFYLGTFDNVDDLIEQMEDHQWAFLGYHSSKISEAHWSADDTI